MRKKKLDEPSSLEDELSLEEIESLLKPHLISHICYGLTLIAPYLHLYRIIIQEAYT